VRDAVRAEVGMVHQHLSLVGNLSVAENLALGGRGRFRPDDVASTLERVSAESGLRVPPTALVRDLTVVEQQRLEILKALSRGARLLILDEPTAVLAPAEIRDLLQWIRAFAERGGTVVLVTHKLREALAAADDVTVLRRGSVVYSGGAAATTEEELGRTIFPEPPAAAASSEQLPPGAVVVRARDVTIHNAGGRPSVRGATFDVRRNEIIGVAAVEGSGHRELLRVLSGRWPVHSGELELPADISLIPADRLREALIPSFDLAENVALRAAGARRGLLSWPAVRRRAAALVEQFGIAARSVRVPVRTLSGGNQQRLVVARELEHDVPFLVADNPTRGLDMRATMFVHEQLRRAAARGAAVVVHSSDVDEVLALATRVLVVFDGVVSEVPGGREAVGRAMLGTT
jgi:simple sugar transport system ATP-binding protein